MQMQANTQSRSGPITVGLLFALFLLPIFVQPTGARAQGLAPEGISQEQSSTEEDASAPTLQPPPFHITANVQGGYDDNSGGSAGGGGSSFVHGGLTLSYELPGERPHLGMSAGASLAYYPDSSARSTSVNTYLNLSLGYPVSTRLSLGGSINVAYQTEPDFSSDVGVENRRANFVHMSGSVSATYNWYERLSTVTSGSLRLVRYDSSSIGLSQDRTEESIGQQFRFNLADEDNVLVADYHFQIVDYDSFPRDSTTHTVLGGIDHGFTEQLKGTARAGATFRSYNGGSDRTDPHFESSLNYSGAHNSSLSWTARYGIEEPNATSAQSRTTFRTGLALGYGVTARISASLTGYYHHDENHGFSSGVIFPAQPSPGFSEDAIDVSVGAHYTINTRFSCSVNYHRSEIISGRAGREYGRNRYSAGLTFTY